MSLLDEVKEIQDQLKAAGLDESVVSVHAAPGEALSIILADLSHVFKLADGSVKLERILKLPELKPADVPATEVIMPILEEIAAHVEESPDPAMPDEANPEIAAANPEVDTTGVE